MDLERIKQNFRIRSGRTKNKKKPAKPTAAPPVAQGSSRPNNSLPNGTVAKEEQVKQEPQQQPQQQPKQEEKESQAPSQQQHPDPTPELTPEPTPESNSTSQIESADINDQRKEQVDINLDNVLQHRPGLPHAATGLPSSQQDQPNSSFAAPGLSRRMTEPHHSTASPSSEAGDFDLNPPKPRPRPPSIETLAELLFSSGHLNSLLHHPPQLARFSAFLQKYLPQDHPLLSQYLETQKAIKAVEYANAVAEGLKPKDTGDGTTTETRKLAAMLDPDFEAVCNAAFKALVGTALQRWVTYQLIKVCSDCLTNEITGRQSTPIMRDLVGGLSEVFCLTDPNQQDNPIIYASEEFYRLTGYGEDDVIGSNCRFLQGRKTNQDSVRRLKEAISKGDEIYETLLNYRRDGRPFINVLMIAPLHDNNGKVKYHIGAQVDVTGLVEGGRALDGFQRYLNRRNEGQRREERELARQNLDDEQRRKKRALARLRDLSEMFDLEESAVVRETSRANSLSRDDDDNRSLASMDRQKTPRRVLGDSDLSEDEEEAREQDREDAANWTLADSGNGRLSGKLPGIYDSFMLFRPYPSLRIVFVSPKLRKLGNVLQTPLLSHVAAPGGVLNGLTESLKAGVPVSAKLHFMPERGVKREGTRLKNGTKHEDGKNGKAIWVSCTPLLGSDERIGVWMCVVVERLKVGTSKRRPPVYQQQADEPSESFEQPTERVESVGRRAERPRKIEIPKRNFSNFRSQDQTANETTPEKDNAPIKPVRIDSQTEIKPSVEKSREPSTQRAHDTNSANHEGTPVSKQEREEDQTSSKPSTASPEELSGTNGHVSASRSPPADADPKAVISPIEEYQEPTHDVKASSVESPSYDPQDASGQDPTADEYVTTRSPTTPSPQNGRILIEEDSDTFADDPTRKAEQSRTDKSDSPSPVWSPASEIPPSIPSDAQLADEDDDLDIESPIHTRQSVDSPTEESASKGEDQPSSRTSSTHQTPPEPEPKIPPSVPATSEDQSQHPDRVEDEEDETLVGPVDTDAYADEQPAKSPDRPHSSRMRMDYLRAGSGRWQQGQNPRRVDLTKMNLSMFERGGASEDDGVTDADCARSPYSVD
ncbi:hypothetical protein H2198_007554 [Neophaeococcomyces mojaviensis]|uniref:Uncharacterized protein n=1 Tax=Neophaeococcomyces mojaviensis TaxID=3383035 RepID=A0ACC2ZZW6_9EURO|nr:hypothetical protein H2198_007554 [Knufia sp. JES_112]